jgi:hypothetical protein
MNRNIFKIIAITLVLSSCAKEKDLTLETIQVNFDAVHTIDINAGQIIPLETNDSSLLYEITKLIVMDDRYVIFSKSKIVVFDLSGKYLCNIGRKGQAPNEYTHIASVFVKNEQIYLYDSMQRKINIYDKNGNFIKYLKLPDNEYLVSDICPLPNGQYIAKNMFQGEPNTTPLLSLLSADFYTINAFSTKYVNSGFTLYDNFFVYDDNILYIEPLCDTIYTIDAQVIAAKYFVDFGKYAIPQSARKEYDVYDLVNYVNQPKNKDQIATLIGRVNEDANYLRFRFILTNVYYLYYHKKSQEITLFKLTDPSETYKVAAYIQYEKGKIYQILQSNIDIETNPSIVVFNEDVFLNNIKI